MYGRLKPEAQKRMQKALRYRAVPLELDERKVYKLGEIKGF